MVGQMGVMPTSYTVYSVFLTMQQATLDPRLHERLLNTRREVWLSLLLGHCSFLLAPAVQKSVLCPRRICFPVLLNSVIKSHGPSE